VEDKDKKCSPLYIYLFTPFNPVYPLNQPRIPSKGGFLSNGVFKKRLSISPYTPL